MRAEALPHEWKSAMNENINIVLACDSRYAQHAAVVMASILLTTSTPARIHFYIIDDELSPDVREKLTKTATPFGSSVRFVQVHEDSLKQGYVSGGISRAAYYRLDIPQLLSEAVHKALYLDCDLLVYDDIVALYETELGKLPLAAAEDFGILCSARKRKGKTAQWGWKYENSYFNSGVILLNLDAWRKENATQHLLELVQQHQYRHHDQDALNEFFEGRWKHLPQRWNVIPPIFALELRVAMDVAMRHSARQAMQRPGIVHYAGGYKPWEYPRTKGFNEYYYDVLAHTAFRDASMPQPGAGKQHHALRFQLWRMQGAKLIYGSK